MSNPDTSERRGNLKNNLLERLHNPTQLRLFLTGLVLLVGYATIYTPFVKQISAVKLKLSETQKRLALIQEVEQFQKQFQPMESQLQQQTDQKEWEHYMLGNIRQFPLKLGSFKPGDARALGPYKVVSMQIDVTGPYAELDRFLYWLESNKRPFRIEQVTISPSSSKSGTDLNMKINLLGVMG